MKIGVISLGCAKNLVDTEIMLGRLIERGWELVHDLSRADLILINTCGFIGPAKEESINSILEAVRYKQPGIGVCAKVVVAGCLVQRYPTELAAEIPEVDLWIGLGEIAELPELLEGAPAARQPDLTKAPFLNDSNVRRYRVTVPHLAYVKIAEGCNHRCSYCTIPLIKGNFRSRRPESIIGEIKQLVESGTREINLIAQDITMYGKDLSSGLNLAGLLRRIITEANPPWVRLLYAYPSRVDAELLDLLKTVPNLCQYLDLPIQHIHPRLLKLMNRHDPPELIRERLARIREAVPGIALRTTMIVGFPTETEAEFEALQNFVAEGHFQHLGVFTYSREEGTAAYRLKPRVPERVMESRRERLMNTQRQISNRLLKESVGREQVALIDRLTGGGKAIGRTEAFAPEVDGWVEIDGCAAREGQFVRVAVTGSDDYRLFAKYLSEV
jgi:ribosomal protein S12 methylthiotransferase